MKILYVTTIGATMGFFRSFISELVADGHAVDIACNDTESGVSDFYHELGCRVYSIPMSRSPLQKENLTAIRQIQALVRENQYDIVHCHTPVAAMCTRLACRKLRRQGTSVFYTAHGFHFYKGAPLANWLIYYPVEKVCSRFTDVLITINKEDFALATKKMRAKQVVYVPGVGIDATRFAAADTISKRQELGIPEDAVLLLSVGELNENKNHETAIRAIAGMDVYYIIAGMGPLQEHLQSVIDALGMTDRVKLLGFRNDIAELCKAADAFVFPSLREGLPVSVMEAMACSLPVACSRIRGNTDLINENGGVLFDPHSVETCKTAVQSLLQKDLQTMGAYNAEHIAPFTLPNVNKAMKDLYNTKNTELP